MKYVVRWLNAGRGCEALQAESRSQAPGQRRFAAGLRGFTRNLMLLGAVCLLAGLASAQTVTILQPTPNSATMSPVRIQATVKDPSPVVATQIYVDGLKVFQSASSVVNAALPMAAGVRHVAVQAWDRTGRTFKSTVNITVGGGTAPAPQPPPAPSAAGVSTWTRLEEQTGWQTCGACGNTGAAGAVANYSMARGIGSPSLDGSSSQFSISGRAFSNGYWWLTHYPAPNAGIKYLGYEFDIYIPAGMENAPQAIEFECQQGLNGWVYNFAWQAEYTANMWRVFNYVTKQWESTGIPLQRFTPGAWHHILAEYHNNPATHQVYHDAITVDGVRHAVTANAVHTAKNAGSGNYFTNAFQLDLNSRGTPFKVYVDQMKVTLK